MSEKLCTLRTKGGGNLKETVLWTNSAPTSSFSAQNVPLSDSIDNYDYIKVAYRRTGVSPNDGIVNAIMSVEDFKDDNTTVAIKICLGYYHTGNGNTYTRLIGYRNSTSISIADCLYYKTGTNTSTNNGGNIPYQIIGLK